MIESIYSVRSFSRCLRKGFGYIFNNPWLVTRVMGPWVLVLSALYVLYYSLLLKTGNDILTRGVISQDNVWESLLLFLLTCIAGHLMLARLFFFFRRNQARIEREELTKRINEGEDVVMVESAKKFSIKDMAKEMLSLTLRMLPYTLWICIFMYVGSNALLILSQWLLTIQSKTTLIFVALGIIALIVALFIFILPLSYTFFHSMMNNTSEGFIKNYRFAFHYKGKILAVDILSGIIGMILCIIPSLPISISYLAFNNNVIAKLIYEEPAIIPTFGYALMLIASILCLSFCTLILLSNYTSMLYLYGSIKTEQNQKGNTISPIDNKQQ